MPKFNFTPEQRLIISLICDLYKKPDERDFSPENIKLIMSAVSDGHDWAIDWEMPGIVPESVDAEYQVDFVADVLGMWEFIELGWSRLGPADKAKVQAAVPYLTEPKFEGFDGNNETEFLAIARMLVEKMGRFSTFKGRSLNSHSPMVDRYEEMLTRWPAVRSTLHSGQMNADQMIELLSRS